MDQLIKLVQEKSGISEEQARQAVTTVVGFLKERLPAPLAGQVDTLLQQDLGAMANQAQGLMQGLGGMFGNKKDDQ